jgi:hypothetical protein
LCVNLSGYLQANLLLLITAHPRLPRIRQLRRSDNRKALSRNKPDRD